MSQKLRKTSILARILSMILYAFNKNEENLNQIFSPFN